MSRSLAFLHNFHVIIIFIIIITFKRYFSKDILFQIFDGEVTIQTKPIGKRGTEK